MGKMFRRWLNSAVFVFALKSLSFAAPVFETDSFTFSIDTYSRLDLVSFKNVTGLDSKNKDDRTLYLGLDYSLGFYLSGKDDRPKCFFKLERNGPYDYDAPIFIRNTLMTSDGVIPRYRNEELLPAVEEFWVDTKAVSDIRLKSGLYTYAVGNGFSLNGGYENFGASIYKESENFGWRFYYCRPDIHNKILLGAHIRQEEEQGIFYEPNAANFFATDLRVDTERQSFRPYIGVLADYTSAGKRDNIFSAPIKRDFLGTVGMAWGFKHQNLSLDTEFAHNFGWAKSGDPEYKDITHTGYLIYAGVEYEIEKFTPSFQFLLCSGNKVNPDMALNEDETLTSGKNRAFSYYSPLNMNLGESISSSNVDMLPIVAMGGGYGLNYGLGRPKTFAAGDFDNLIMPCLGLDFRATEKLLFSFFLYYLRSFQRGVGVWEGEGKYLSPDLGMELDAFIDYRINQNILVSLLGGYFIPGRYYKEEREDTQGSLLSPFVRGDGEADPAYQIELALEVSF